MAENRHRVVKRRRKQVGIAPRLGKMSQPANVRVPPQPAAIDPLRTFFERAMRARRFNDQKG
jgi:hypothetical protein